MSADKDIPCVLSGVSTCMSILLYSPEGEIHVYGDDEI